MNVYRIGLLRCRTISHGPLALRSLTMRWIRTSLVTLTLVCSLVVWLRALSDPPELLACSLPTPPEEVLTLTLESVSVNGASLADRSAYEGFATQLVALSLRAVIFEWAGPGAGSEAFYLVGAFQ